MAGFLFQVFEKYFLPQHAHLIQEAISTGRVECNGKILLNGDVPLHKDDVLSYTKHWHEPEVRS